MRHALGLILTILSASAVVAQQQSVDTGQFDPTLRNVTRTAAPQVSLTFSSDDKSAKVQWGREWMDAGVALAIAGPLDEDNDRTTLGTAEGLQDSVNAELTGKYTYHSESLPLSAAEFKELCRKYKTDSANLCESGSRQDLNARGQAIFDDMQGWHLITALSGKWGTKKFTYADTTSLEETDARKNGWSVAGGVSWITQYSARALYSATLSYRHESAWKAQDAAFICEPLEGGTAEKCTELPFGAPGTQKKNLVTLETRHFLSDNMALVPRAKWETEEGDYSFELPLYLRQDDGPFNGGVSLTWDSKSNDLVVGVFVGALTSL
jgi:hypothetical protein